jgi:hypothetical protein
MNVFPFFGFARVRMFGMRVFCIATMSMVVLGSAIVSPMPAAAQMEFDFNGDGTVTCADFEEEFPDTFTDEATEALRQYPDDLGNLNRDSEDDDIACEGQPASEPTPEPTQAPDSPAAEPEAEAPATTSPEAADVPADVMARVEGCAVIAISPHDLVGAGCPGVGVVTYHVPDGAPLLKGTVIMNPGAALATEADRAPESTAATGTNGSAQNDNNAERAQNAANAGKDKDKAQTSKRQSADDTKASKGKGKKQDGDGKNRKNKKKGGKDKKGNNKGGKNKNKKDKQ